MDGHVQMRKCGWIWNMRMHVHAQSAGGRWEVVVGQTAPGAGMAGTDRQVQMQCDLAGDGGGHVHVSEMLPGVAGEWWWASRASVEAGSLQDVGDEVSDCVQMQQCDQIWNMHGSAWVQEN